MLSFVFSTVNTGPEVAAEVTTNEGVVYVADVVFVEAYTGAVTVIVRSESIAITSVLSSCIVTPVLPFRVSTPEFVVKLEAVAAVIATPALESIVVAAALISRTPVVVISISAALPSISIPQSGV